MEWNCLDSDRRLSDYLEGRTTPEETAAFEAHLASCSDCAALLARVGATVKMLRATRAVEVPPQLFRKIVRSTSGAARAARGWRRWVRPAAIAWQPQFAMGAITIAASFLILFHAANSSRSSQTLGVINPIALFRAADRQVHLTYAHTAKFVDNLRLVYEIQSRLEPDQEQAPEPSSAPPDSKPPAQPPNSSPAQPQPKSEAQPHSNREFHARPVLASATQQRILRSDTRSHS